MDYHHFGMGKEKHRFLNGLVGGVPNGILIVCRSIFVRQDLDHQNLLLTNVLIS